MPARLDKARTRVAAMMGDTCRIFRDPDGNTGDAIDPDTLALIPPDPSGANIYAGPCEVVPLGAGRSTGLVGERGDADVSVITYRVGLPWDGPGEMPVIRRDDQVVILESEGDWQLRGMRLRVLEVERRSTRVKRTLICEVIQ